MSASYRMTKLDGGDVFVSSDASEVLPKVDSVVFDCDGTLIDVRESYATAILKTAASMTEGFFGDSIPLEPVGNKLILEIRRTGGFNSDWDTSYALALFSAVAIKEQGSENRLGRLDETVRDFSSKERLAGWRSVDDYLAISGLETEPVREMRRYLEYPGNPLTSKLAAAFDQVYYGEDLYRSIYGVEPEVGYRKGLIDKERVIITEESLKRISDRIGGRRIAMATGRPFVAVEHTLGPLLEYFERGASVYIGDGDIYPELAPKLAKFRKPSGDSLVLARKALNSKALLYVGDSAEDRLMVRNAASGRGTILFAGIYGGSVDEKEQIFYFSKAGSDVVVRDANQIADVLEMVSS